MINMAIKCGLRFNSYKTTMANEKEYLLSRFLL